MESGCTAKFGCYSLTYEPLAHLNVRTVKIPSLVELINSDLGIYNLIIMIIQYNTIT